MRTAPLLGLLLAACKDDPSTDDGPGDGTIPTNKDGVTSVDTGDGDEPPVPNQTTTGGDEQCVLLYGGNDRVRGPDEGLPLGDTSRTVQVWVRTNSELEQIAISYGRPSPEQGFLVGTSGGYPMVRAGSSSQVVLGETWIADDRWHHLVASFDGRSAVITLDGEPEAVGDLAAFTLEGDTVAGNTPTGDLTKPWVGWLDDVRIFEGARWSTDIADDPEGLLEDPGDLRLWWDFEVTDGGATGPGVVVEDLSGNGHHGTTGGAENTPTFPACR